MRAYGRCWKTVLLAGVVWLGSARIEALDAFPGAEGEGRETIGGRGGQVIEVTSLDDSGPGTLRAALDTNAPRIIVFRVSGTIELATQLVVSFPYVTIAGQTAPGDGICIKNYNFQVPVGQVIIRYLRFRPGNSSGQEVDSLSISGGDNIIIDHCSASWSVDECLSASIGQAAVPALGDLNHLTVQWCIVSEGLANAGHQDGEHSKGSLLRGGGGNKYSFHHNLYAHLEDRLPYVGNYQLASADPTGLYFDFRNNVVYDWGGSNSSLPPSSNAEYENKQTVARFNFINNYYKRGPESPSGTKAFIAGNKSSRGFFSGNAFDGTVPGDPYSLITYLTFNFPFIWSSGEQTSFKLASELSFASVATDSAAIAYTRVLNEAGATLPARDAVDARIVSEVANGTGSIIDLPSEVGGWPTLNSTAPPVDSDHDGMPDLWENSHGLNANDAADGALDRDSDGYTNVEEYLNGIVAGLPVPVTLSEFSAD